MRRLECRARPAHLDRQRRARQRRQRGLVPLERRAEAAAQQRRVGAPRRGGLPTRAAEVAAARQHERHERQHVVVQRRVPLQRAQRPSEPTQRTALVCRLPRCGRVQQQREGHGQGHLAATERAAREQAEPAARDRRDRHRAQRLGQVLRRPCLEGRRGRAARARGLWQRLVGRLAEAAPQGAEPRLGGVQHRLGCRRLAD